MYNSGKEPKTFLYAIDKVLFVGYNTHRWMKAPRNVESYVLGHIFHANIFHANIDAAPASIRLVIPPFFRSKPEDRPRK